MQHPAGSHRAIPGRVLDIQQHGIVGGQYSLVAGPHPVGLVTSGQGGYSSGGRGGHRGQAHTLVVSLVHHE